jgi:Arc/MetJ-type ribon-helix-helix transcriptional regulator
VLNLSSTSDALREGLRLLAREAAEVGAADELRAFYHGQPAPLPEGVAPVDESELEEVDRMQW